jgi:hypothetical protein
MITIDDRELKEFEADLKTFARRAFPFATKSTVNGLAFKARSIAQEGLKRDLVLRNRFTVQSVQVDQTRTLDVRRQAAAVGSIAPYMEVQEFGGIKTKSGSEGVSISTGYSAGQENAKPRTRLPRKANKLENITLKKRRGKRISRKQQNLLAIKQAAASGSKFIFLDLGRRQGIFKVIGGKRRPKIKMVHDLTSQSVVIPKSPWLLPAVTEAQLSGPEIYKKALAFQLKRQGLFKG